MHGRKFHGYVDCHLSGDLEEDNINMEHQMDAMINCIIVFPVQIADV